MRNFGNDSYGSQQHYHQHHQLSYPPPPLGLPPAVKMEPFPLSKTIGAGSNLKQLNKSHFSPVNIVAPTPHDHHQHHQQQHHHQNHLSSSGGHNTNNNNVSNNGIPINLSHASGTVVSSSAAATTVANHSSLMPTATLAAACPTPANRGPSPTHHQIPANGLPYHPSHSPTLPVANTALPFETHNAPKVTSTGLGGNTGGGSSYHQNSMKSQHFQNHSPPASDPTVSNNPNSALGNRSGGNSTSGLTSRTSDDVTPSHPPASGGNPQLSGNNGSSSNATPSRIVSQNVNGTLAVTGIPTNESELQLFRVLQRANLLSYFDMMIELGGDDVQQLCEAGEAEFLEIMALIGMAAKPLHVRRLQKALQEWMTQPSLFQSPVLPPGYHHFGVSHVDRTISHTQYTSTTIASSNVTGGTGQQPHHPQPVIPIPHLVSQNPVSPYPAHNAPSMPYITDTTSTSSNDSSKSDSHKTVKSHERSGSSPLSSTTMGGLHPAYLAQQQGSPAIPVVISTSQTYPGQGQSSNLSSYESHYQNCPSPSGSTSSRSSTISIRSHHHQHPFHPSSPMEHSPGSPASSESGRSYTKHGEESTTSSELENTSSYDQSNSPQTLDNSSGTTTGVPPRVTSRSSSRSSSCGGSEPNSPPAVPSPASMTKGIILQTGDSPRPSTESVTNRTIPTSNNSVAVTSHDYYSLQEHEIQKLAEAAVNLVRSLPQNVKEPKFSKKIETSSYETVLRLAEDDPRKMDEIRRLSAIFGKSEQGKRSKSNGLTNNSVTKPVSVLELAMNESAAQLCKLVPALLTRREELYSLSRQVIRDSGLPYSVISANSNLPGSFMLGVNNNNNNEAVAANKLKIVEIRNSPAHEERISFEFAAACKKIKFDMQSNDNQVN
ncbi:unnamed protein product [Orchesella dallaii]|uniref:NGFI-A-binding protein n=1 Tax=Orchesella dallaii TaxID=48710 RepID=A0ABP1QP28_9HEXA